MRERRRVQRSQRAAERLVVRRCAGRLHHGNGNDELVVDEHHCGNQGARHDGRQLAQPVCLVAGARPHLGHELLSTGFDSPGVGAQRPYVTEPSHFARQAVAPVRHVGSRRHPDTLAPWRIGQTVPMPRRPRVAGLVITPGASAGREHPGLVAIETAVTPFGIAVERVEFPGQAAGKRRTDTPAVCIDTVRRAAAALAERLEVSLREIAVGGRSFGGRMCSMAVADGLEAAALVLVSYPLHPPGKPERLRTEHFSRLQVPCLFVSGRRDAFATPEELERETAAIPGGVTLTFVEGDHSLRRSEREAADAVAAWLDRLR